MHVTNEIENQKSIAVEVLNKLRVIDRDAFLAGGAVRDWYFGKPAKDLDIYIDGCGIPNYEQLVIAVEGLLGTKVVKVGSEVFTQYASNPNLMQVVQTTYKGISVQIMKVLDRRNVVKSFPFGICQCGMDWRGKMYYTANFHQEVKYRSLVIRNPLYKDKDKYIEKIRSYFPEWRFFNGVDSFLNYVIEKE